MGSPPFEDQDAALITKTRLDRLTPENRREAHALLEQLENPAADGKEGDKNVLPIGPVYIFSDSALALEALSLPSSTAAGIP